MGPIHQVATINTWCYIRYISHLHPRLILDEPCWTYQQSYDSIPVDHILAVPIYSKFQKYTRTARQTINNTRLLYNYTNFRSTHHFLGRPFSQSPRFPWYERSIFQTLAYFRSPPILFSPTHNRQHLNWILCRPKLTISSSNLLQKRRRRRRRRQLLGQKYIDYRISRISVYTNLKIIIFPTIKAASSRRLLSEDATRLKLGSHRYTKSHICILHIFNAVSGSIANTKLLLIVYCLFLHKWILSRK